MIAGAAVAWGEGRNASDERVRTLLVRARLPLDRRPRTLYRSSLPKFSRYDSVLFADLDASQQAVGVILDMSEACCGSVFRVRGGAFGKSFRRLSSTEGPSFIDVDGPRVAFAEDASYSNDPASDDQGGLPPEAPCDEPGLPACSTINVRDVRDNSVVVLPAPAGTKLTNVRLAGRYVAWVERRSDADPIVSVWDLVSRTAAYTVPGSSWGGDISAIDLEDDGTVAVAVRSGRLGYATLSEPHPHGLAGVADRGHIRLSGGRLAFRSPRGALKVAPLDGIAKAVVRAGTRRDRWDFSGQRITWTHGHGRRATVLVADVP